MSIFQEIPANKKSLGKRSKVFDVGINDLEYQITIISKGKKQVCPYYLTWANMLKRCYDPKSLNKNPTYINCTVCPEWHTFSNFKAWMIEQDWIGKQLDKDILEIGNKIYSPSTCIFVSPQLNSLLNTQENKRGKYPIGVCWDKQCKKFKAQCSIKGLVKNLGTFQHLEDACKAYIMYKKQIIISIANKQVNTTLQLALLNYAEKLQGGYVG